MRIESAFPQDDAVKPFVVAVQAFEPAYGGGESKPIGSGILIQHQNNIFLLTAAHNFFKSDDEQEKPRNDLQLTIGNRPPIKISIHEEAIMKRMDIAMVPLNDNELGRSYPVSRYPSLHPGREETRPLTIYGFTRSPLETLEIEKVNYNLDGKDDPRISQEPLLRECFIEQANAYPEPSYDLVYTTYMPKLQPGLSGSPIIPNTNENGQVLVFGIHQRQCSNFDKNGPDNQGSGISSEEIAKLFNLDVSGSGVDTPQVQNSQVQDFSETGIAPNLKYPVEVTW